MLSISDVIMRHLRLFIEKGRSRLTGISCADTAPAFASWSGKMMATSMVSTQLNTFWRNAVNIDLRGRITATLLRKMTTTAVHSNAPELKRSLANLMNHDVRTAEREYFLQEKKKTVAATSSQLRKIIRTDYEGVEENTLKEIFADEIKNNSIKIEDVRLKMKSHPDLKEWDELKLRDKVNYLLFKYSPLLNCWSRV